MEPESQTSLQGVSIWLHLEYHGLVPQRFRGYEGGHSLFGKDVVTYLSLLHSSLFLPPLSQQVVASDFEPFRTPPAEEAFILYEDEGMGDLP